LRSGRRAPLDTWGNLPGGVQYAPAERPPGKLKPGPGRPAAEVADHQQWRIRGALLELVAERGYDGVTVRELAGSAGVSTRSFYKHYPSKESCFLDLHQFVVRRVLRGIEVARLGAPSLGQRLRLVVEALVREWASDPKAARLMLVDVYAAGSPALKQARLASRSIEVRIGECLDYAPDNAGLAPLAAEGIVAGIFAAARNRLLDGKGVLGHLGVPLGRWAAAYQEFSAKQIAEVKMPERQVPIGDDDDATASSGGKREETAAPQGDRALLLAATARLVAVRRNVDLGLEDIASTAGISRRGLEAEFPNPEACIAAAHQLYADRAVDSVARAGEELFPDGDARLALASLGVQLVSDTALASLCFSDVAISGPLLVCSHQRFLARLARLAAGTTESPDPAAEASAGALWGPLHQRVVMDRATQVLEIAPALTALALHPLQAEAGRL
jgi:AcrR family transcriptional regulator